MSTTSNLRLEDQLCFALYGATNAVTRAYRPLLEVLGLTYPQYLVLLVLWADGERPVTQIAHRLGLPPHAVSPILHRLEQAGLVTRERRGSDRRVVTIALTPAGTELETEASRVQYAVVEQTRLACAELEGLRDELHDLVRRMDARTDAPTDARTDAPTDARTDPQTDGQAHD
ncbi:MAG: transcriptional regulator [Humibacillus sp.]|nr:transcriptional regulator [Humibacillus sp.]